MNTSLISPLADIHPNATIGDNVSIGAFSVIGDNVSIGDNSEIAPHVVLKGPTKIGKNNKIYQFASIGDAPQDLKFGTETTYLEIGDDNVFREYCSVNRGTKHGGGTTRIGNNNLFITYSHIAHDCQIGDFNVIGNACALAGHVIIGDRVTLSGYTKISQFLSIGSFVFTAMGIGITKHIPPFSWVAGDPARAVTINKIGLSRNGFSDEDVKQAKKLHRLFFKTSGLKLDEITAKVYELTKSHPNLKQFSDFVQQHQNHKIGILRK